MDPSIERIRASDGTGNANVATVTTIRNALSTTILVDTVLGIPDTFAGSMGTPHTFIDPVTNEEITVISEETAVDFAGHVDGSNLEIDEIAPGYTDAGSAVGDIIVIRPTSQWADNLADVMAVTHEDNGEMKAAIPVTGAAAYTFEPLTGWRTDPNTFTYVSGTGTTTAVFKVTGVDVTDHLQAGMPFVAVQGGVSKYGFITKVAFSTDTTITAFMAATAGTVDNSGIANAAITSFKFGLPKQPGFGFPLDPTKWTITTTSTSNRSTTSTTFVTFTDAITVPIGAWKLGWRGEIVVSAASEPASARVTYVTLSDVALSGTTVTYDELTMACRVKASSAAAVIGGSSGYLQKYVSISTSTTYTMYGRSSSSSPTTTASLDGATYATVITAICAYL